MHRTLPPLNDFKALTFDCYGTLIDWEQGILAELRPWVSRSGLNVSDDALLEAFGELEAACEAATPSTLYTEILENVMHGLAERFSVSLGPDDATAFGASVGRWPAFPDSPASLQYLQRHYKLVIISNVDHASFAKSQEKLGVRFDRVITAQDVGSYKPSLKNFQYALHDIQQALGIDREHILHTAQSIFHDVVPAKSIGLHTMWINRRKGLSGWGATPAPGFDDDRTRPDFEVRTMADFAELHRISMSSAPGSPVRV